MTPEQRAEKIVEILKEAKEAGTPFVGHFEILNVAGQSSCNWSISWNEEVQDLLKIPSHEVAHVLGVLGNEIRLSILRELLAGPKTAVQLTEALGMQTTGQAYHHLKELQRSGYVSNKKSDKYSLDMKFGRIYVAALALAWNAGAGREGDQESR